MTHDQNKNNAKSMAVLGASTLLALTMYGAGISMVDTQTFTANPTRAIASQMHVSQAKGTKKVTPVKPQTDRETILQIADICRKHPVDKATASADVSDDAKVTAYFFDDTKTIILKGDGHLNAEKWFDFLKQYAKSNKMVTIVVEDQLVFPEKSRALFSSSYKFGGRRDVIYNPVINPNVDTSNVTDMSFIFTNTAGNPNVSHWDTSKVEDLNFAFSGCHNANPDVSNWDTSQVKKMKGLFSSAKVATPDVSKWDTSKVEDMGLMFEDTVYANPDVSGFDTSNVVMMDKMFTNATAANPDVSKWDTSKVRDMQYIFYHAAQADPDVTNWDVSKVEKLQFAFSGSGLSESRFENWNPNAFEAGFLSETKVKEVNIPFKIKGCENPVEAMKNHYGTGEYPGGRPFYQNDEMVSFTTTLENFKTLHKYTEAEKFGPMNTQLDGGLDVKFAEKDNYGLFRDDFIARQYTDKLATFTPDMFEGLDDGVYTFKLTEASGKTLKAQDLTVKSNKKVNPKLAVVNLADFGEDVYVIWDEAPDVTQDAVGTTAPYTVIVAFNDGSELKSQVQVTVEQGEPYVEPVEDKTVVADVDKEDSKTEKTESSDENTKADTEQTVVTEKDASDAEGTADAKDENLELVVVPEKETSATEGETAKGKEEVADEATTPGPAEKTEPQDKETPAAGETPTDKDNAAGQTVPEKPADKDDATGETTPEAPATPAGNANNNNTATTGDTSNKDASATKETDKAVSAKGTQKEAKKDATPKTSDVSYLATSGILASLGAMISGFGISSKKKNN